MAFVLFFLPTREYILHAQANACTQLINIRVSNTHTIHVLLELTIGFELTGKHVLADV